MVGRNIHRTLDNDPRQVKGQLNNSTQEKCPPFLYLPPLALRQAQGLASAEIKAAGNRLAGERYATCTSQKTKGYLTS